jgi:hypothetical protein
MNKRKYKEDEFVLPTIQTQSMAFNSDFNSKKVRDDYSDFKDDPELCVCEYINNKDQRSHMIQCCCNCEAVDKLCTLICCCECLKNSNSYEDSDHETNLSENSEKPTIAANFKRAWSDIEDRLRVPYPGGARKINITFFLAWLYIFIFIFIGGLNIFFTFMCIIGLPACSYAFFFWSRLTNRSYGVKLPFFTSFNSYLMLFVLFNWFLNEEFSPVLTSSDKYRFNILILAIVFFHLWIHFSDPGKLTTGRAEKETNKLDKMRLVDENTCKKCMIKRDDQAGHCPECGKCIYKRDLHCYWLGNCIGYSNQKLYVIYLILLVVHFTGLLSMLYRRLHAYECRMSKLWHSSSEKIQNNNELSCLFDVYYTNYARAFILAAFLQLLPMTGYFIMILIQKFIFIGMDITHLDVYRMGQRNVRFSLFLFLSSHFEFKTAVRNWFKFLLKIRKNRDILIYQQTRQDHSVSSNSPFFSDQHLV